MPVLTTPGVTIDYADEGRGRPVVLIHSSVSGNRQWRSLTDALSDRYRVLAPNLYGYGATSPWPRESPQTLHAQAELIAAVCEEAGDPVHLVGHSFGGSVALAAAALLGSRVDALVLLEPNPFSLLKHGDRTSAFLETRDLREHMQRCAALDDWTGAAERFADYWLGEGAWRSMPEKRQAAFAESLPPVFHEWEAAMDEGTTVEQFRALTCRTLVVSDPATRPPIREIVDVLAEACPHWSFRSLGEGGHMAPLTRPELVNPIVRQFLDAG